MMQAPIDVDASRWIRVPVDFAAEQWQDGPAWVEWVCWSAAPDDEQHRDRIRLVAAAIVELPAAGLLARYWHFPEDGDPGAAMDVTVVLRAGDPLLPEAPSELVVEPLEWSLDMPGFDRAALRRSLVPVEGDSDVFPVLALAEWAAAVDGIVVGMTAADTDPARLSRLIVDGDQLLASLDGRALAAMIKR